MGTYARRMAAAGYAALAFDHRGFGESGGRRQHEDPGASSPTCAPRSASWPPSGGRRGPIGLLGVCLGGGYAVRAAAFDPRVTAVAGVAGGYNSPAAFARSMGTEAYRGVLARFVDSGDARMPAVSAEGRPRWAAASRGSTTAPSARPARTGCNEVTAASLYSLMTLDVLSSADLLERTPLLVVHGTHDDYCSPAGAQALVRPGRGPKTLEWIETTNHIELYDSEPHLDQALEKLVAFYGRELTHA